MSVGRIVGIVVVLVAAGLGVAFALGAFEEAAPPPDHFSRSRGHERGYLRLIGIDHPRARHHC